MKDKIRPSEKKPREHVPGGGWNRGFWVMWVSVHQPSRIGKRNIRAYALRHHGSQYPFDLKAYRLVARLADGEAFNQATSTVT